ncbi:unnamed protein product [Symbiodinium necroappetens]|uniref:Uncharacterized protein n=1 Tax=Symbiodinium necroappetens TaxID=1628268 RepID=A0A812T9I5_9DINO|nr:unnamed protein product [Symbiodinium necroappetens]
MPTYYSSPLGQGSWSEISVKKNAKLQFSKTEEWTIGSSAEGSGPASGVAARVPDNLPNVAFNYFVVTVGRVTTMDEMKVSALGSGQENHYLDLFDFLKMNTKTVDVRQRLQGGCSVILFDSAEDAASAAHLFMKGCMPIFNLLNLKFNMQDNALVASVSVVPSSSSMIPYSILHGEPHSVNDILKTAQLTGMTGSLSVVAESDFQDLRHLRAEALQSRPYMKRRYIQVLESEIADEKKGLIDEKGPTPDETEA